MPFTGSHPAAVLPLLRTGLPASALVIGSMTPDLPYYLPTIVGSSTTHSALGVVSVDLLFGVVCLAVWHTLLAPAAVAVAPSGLRTRLSHKVPGGLGRLLSSVRGVLAVVAALIVGAATHVFWDTFTHANRWGTRHVTWLAHEQGPVAGYRWAQYASGLIGAVAIAAWLGAWWRRTPPKVRDVSGVPAIGRRGTVYAGAVLAGAVVVGALVGALPSYRHGGAADLHRAAFLAFTRGCGAGALATLGLALIFLFVQRRDSG